ncbi:MAG: glutathione S-transferase family protein [Alphaproteobacteria bacterium]|nr:glutathione S-transferase family protein [Alphaproteobacteria bacterium]
MGLLIDGVWSDENVLGRIENGRYIRRASQFRNWITGNGAPGPSGDGGFTAQAGRYHLYVSHACPWAHRTMIMRALKGLEDFISVSVTHWLMRENGWNFADGPGVVADPVGGAQFMYQVYQRANATYSGRVTVPVLWDKERNTIVCNESSEIIRMFNSAFDGVGAKPGDFYPQALRSEIDALNERIYNTLNNGVYRCGFATTQDAYNEAFALLFDTLDMLEDRLSRQRYLCGPQITEADIRLLPTLLRFDAVYHGHFKCNRNKIAEMPNLWAYTRDLYQQPGVAATFNFDHAKKHYYSSHLHINPTGIVPAGPRIDFNAPHDRGKMG